jgi:internalin A
MLSWRYAEIEFLGLPKLTDERSFRLEHIYVPLRLCRNWSERFNDQRTFHVPKALQTQRHLVVLGDPGSGKSTLVKVLTYAFGAADSNAYKSACGELIPIPIILRDHKIHQWRNYDDLLNDFISKLDNDIRNEITSEWLLERLGNGRAILLIDGLDEVGRPEERLRLRDDIIFPLLRRSVSCPIVLTSRIVGYDEVPFDFVPIPSSSKADEIYAVQDSQWLLNRCFVAPFDDNQISQFVTRWYQLREASPGKQREGVDSLLWALNQNDRVKRLAHNPQLLTLIALIHRVTANLPSGRVELYDKIVEAYLETIQVYRKLGTPAKLDEMKRWLAKVGWEMQERRDEWTPYDRFWSDDRLSVSRENIRQWLTEAIAKERNPARASELADDFLDYVARRSGLLVPNGPETFSFSHLTFQEYFAAFELRGEVRWFDKLGKRCADLSMRRQWHETLNLLFEMLGEFPAAGDDLFDEIASRTRDDIEARSSVAGLFSALLLDEQSGLRQAKRREAAAFALTTICERYDGSVIKDLQSLPAEDRSELIGTWFTDMLGKTVRPRFGEYFFVNGDQLIEDWPRKLKESVVNPNYRELTELQVAETGLIGARDEEMYYKFCPWVIERLPLKLWLKRISHSFGDGGGLSLVEIYRRALFSECDNTPRSLLLLEMGLALAITKSQILRLALALISRALPYKRGPYDRDGEDQRYLTSGNNDLNGSLRDAVTRALPRAPIRDLARDLAHDLAIDGSGTVERDLARFLSDAVESERPFPDLRKNNRLSTLLAAERALFAPYEGIKATNDLRAKLETFLCKEDHWSRLLASSALLMLGEGSPKLCRTRNELLIEGLKRSNQFTFPSELHAETQSEDFRKQLPELLDLVFQQSRSRRWLKSDLFDRNRAFSKYFVTKPHEFFDVAMGVLNNKQAAHHGLEEA